MIRVYENIDSGNCYKIRLLLAQLGIPYERIEVDTEAGQTRTTDFLKLNPNGRVPLIRTEDGKYLAESGAIQWWLADSTSFLPDERFARGCVLQWMFFEQYSHEPYIAVLRHWNRGGQHRAQPHLVEEKTRLGYAALGVMERHLTQEAFFAAQRYTIADISLYAYTHVAAEGGFSLAEFPRVREWIARVEDQPDYVPFYEQ